MDITIKKLKILWFCITAVLFWRSYRHYQTEEKYYYTKQMLGITFLLSRASASVLNLNCLLILLPVCRFLNSYIHATFNLMSRSCLKFWLHNMQDIHTTIALTIFIASVIHSIGHVFNAINASVNFSRQYRDINWAFYENENPVLLVLGTISGSTGLLMMFILITMSIFSLRWFRSSDYVLFSTSHQLFVPFFLLYMIHPLSLVLKEQVNYADHVPGCRKNCTTLPVFQPIPLQNWMWLLPGLIAYSFDLLYRVLRRNKLYFRVQEVVKYPGDVYKLVLSGSRAIKVCPAEYILLQCVEISTLEWHPFTVVSTSTWTQEAESYVSVYIRVCGDWTDTLSKYLQRNNSINETCDSENFTEHSMKAISLHFLIDGSFYSPLSDLLQNDIAFCVATGIGITPFGSVLTYLQEHWDARKGPKGMHLIWVVPYAEHILWFDELLRRVDDKNWMANKPDRFNYSLYVTRELESKNLQDVIHNPVLRSRVHFGRPDWCCVLQTWHSFYFRSSYPLYVCGSKPVLKTLQKTCNKLSKKNIVFNCVHEAFT